LPVPPAHAHRNGSPDDHTEAVSAGPRPVALEDYAVHAPRMGGDFALTNQDGRPVRLSQFRPRPVLVFFGYTYCPDLCPVTTAKLALVRRTVKDQGMDAQPVLVSIDPERDSPARMKAYLSAFGEDIVGMTGRLDDVRQAAKQFRVRVKKEEAGGLDPYLVGHTAYLYLIDGQGRLRYVFPADVDNTLIVQAIRLLAAG